MANGQRIRNTCVLVHWGSFEVKCVEDAAVGRGNSVRVRAEPLHNNADIGDKNGPVSVRTGAGAANTVGAAKTAHFFQSSTSMK